MLEGHKYFHSTPFLDKTNEYIFLKKSKKNILSHFLTIFGHFCRKGIFPKNWDLSRTFPYGSHNTIHSFRKETNEPIPSKLLGRRTDRRTHGRTGLNSYDPSGHSLQTLQTLQTKVTDEESLATVGSTEETDNTEESSNIRFGRW